MKITHPRPEAGRQEFIGVEFRDGVAFVDELHPERRLALTQHGATIEEGFVNLEELTRRELIDIAEVEGVTVKSKMTRRQLIDALASLPADPIPESIDNGDGSFTHGGDDA